MASEFITRVERGKDEPYTVIFRTDDADKYKHIEDECRRMIGHEKPTVDAVHIAYCQFKKNASGVNRYCTKCGAYLEDREYENHTIKFCYYCGSRVVLEKGERNDDQQRMGDAEQPDISD